MRAAGWLLPLVALLPAAMANDAAVVVQGGAVQMLDGRTNVRMVSAKISADLRADHASVRCEYSLRNEGRAQRVTIGFPEMPELGAYGHYPAHLQGFRSWADGKPLRVRLRVGRGEEERRQRWFVRRVRFGRGQTRSIVDQFTQSNGRYPMGGGWEFVHTVWTARSWKGPIGRLEVTVRWREPYVWERRTAPIPPRTTSDVGRTLTWSWTKVEPAPDRISAVRVPFWPGWARAVVDGKQTGVGFAGYFHVYPDITMAPVRGLAELLGLNCARKGGNVELTDKQGHVFVCRVGSADAVANGRAVVLRRKAEDIGGRVVVPLRPVSEAFGVRCSLDRNGCRVVLEHGTPPATDRRTAPTPNRRTGGHQA